jgi:sec-independent protein translocase protein TatB
MFDLAWSHLLLIGVVALLVIGPKDLPRVLRTVGFWVGRARSVAREFQGSLDQMIREAELEEVRKQVESAATLDLDHTIGRTIDPAGELKRSVTETTIAEVPTPPAVEPAPPAPEAAAPTSAMPVEELPSAAPETPEAPPAKSGTHD